MHRIFQDSQLPHIIIILELQMVALYKSYMQMIIKDFGELNGGEVAHIVSGINHFAPILKLF